MRGTVHTETLVSEVLAGNPWGDPTERDLIVVTPKGYGDKPLPVVLILAGFIGTGEKMLARGLTDISVARWIDRLIADGCPPFIAVLPDCMSTLGGTQFVDSPAIGNYATHMVEEVVPFVEARFSTNGRWGVMGRSSGGFGALHLAMRFPGRFQAVACHSGDMGFPIPYLEDVGATVRALQKAGGIRPFIEQFWQSRSPSRDAFSTLNLLCMSAAYSPDIEQSPFPARIPVDWQTGRVDFDVFDAWAALDPVVRDDLGALKELEFLFIDCGDRDEHLLHLGARQLRSRLTEFGVAHTYEEYAGGHRGTGYRVETSLPLMAAVLS